jgi:sulfide:quinone oxidoreductase
VLGAQRVTVGFDPARRSGEWCDHGRGRGRRHPEQDGPLDGGAVGDCTQIPTATAQLPKAGVFAAAEGVVAARNIAADLGAPGATGDRFEGHGFCFLELPGENVAFVEGDFYAEPTPDVTLTPADHDQFRRKQEYERSRLGEWLG